MKASLISLVILAIAFLATGCRHQSATTRLPEITSESEEGYHDLVLGIEDHQKLSDGSQRILASGMYQGKKVSLEILLGPAWRSGAINADVPITTFLGSVSYRSIGVESDLLLQAMDEVYGTKKAPKAMNKVTEFSAISLEGDPKNLTKGLVKIKLFFESNSEDQYAELFTNIDLTARKLYISEKDEEYRAAIVRALQAP